MVHGFRKSNGICGVQQGYERCAGNIREEFYDTKKKAKTEGKKKAQGRVCSRIHYNGDARRGGYIRDPVGCQPV